jgi:hypothetical protein
VGVCLARWKMERMRNRSGVGRRRRAWEGGRLAVRSGRHPLYEMSHLCQFPEVNSIVQRESENASTRRGKTRNVVMPYIYATGAASCEATLC